MCDIIVFGYFIQLLNLFKVARPVVYRIYVHTFIHDVCYMY